MRQAFVERQTKETYITMTLDLDGDGIFDGSSGIGFFDHMLDAFAKHSGYDIILSAKGDLDVDCHHTIEDIGIVLGTAFSQAIGDKDGINRYGNFAVPMDEALARANVDISGRAYLVFNAEFNEERVGNVDTCMIEEFFRAFAFNSKMTLHLNLLYGKNSHHCIEALFKAAAHALGEATKITGSGIVSTKGVL